MEKLLILIQNLAIKPVLNYLILNRQKWVLWVMAVIGTASVLFLFFVGMLSTYPAAAEVIQYIGLWIGIFMNAALVLSVTLVIIAAMFYNFGKGITLQRAESSPVGLLTAGRCPDILVFSLPGETLEEYDNRKNAARTDARPNRWAVIIQYQKRTACIVTGHDKNIFFSRDTPPFQSNEWPDEIKVAIPGDRFGDETPEQYTDYINRFMVHYPEWADTAKIEFAENGRTETYFGTLSAKAAAVVLFIFCVVPAFGQTKSDQVISAFHGRIPVPEKGADISFVFEDGKTLSRIGNGRANYVDLLQSVPGFRNTGGKLVAIYNGTSAVARAGDVERVNEGPNLAEMARGNYIQPSTTGDPIRPRGVSAIDPEQVQRGNYYKMFQDSQTMVDYAERAKYEIWQMTQTAGKAAKPWWAVVMFTLWQILPFVVIFGAISWLAAIVAAKEGMYELHKQARHAFAILALCFGGILLVNFLLMAISADLGPAMLLLVAIVETYIAYKAIEWIIPDFRPSRGNQPREHQQTQFRQLGQ